MADQYFGKYSAIVKDNQDADELGILQVSVPTIFPADELVAARAALPYGMFFVPEVDTQIWVEFEGGDTEFPIWTGVQHIAGTWAPEAAKNPPTVRAFKTAAGHLLIFDDTSGSESIVLTDGVNAHRLKFDADGITLTDGQSNHVIEMGSSAVTVKHGGGVAKVTLEAAAVKAEAGPASVVTVTSGEVTVNAPKVTVGGGQVLLGAGLAPVLHLGDQGIGNLGAPVPITITTQMQVMA